MAAEAVSDPVAQAPKAKKNKKKKSKPAAAHSNGGESGKPAAPEDAREIENDTADEDVDSPIGNSNSTETKSLDDTSHVPPVSNGVRTDTNVMTPDSVPEQREVAAADQESNSITESPEDEMSSEERFEAAARQRDELRNEVIELRKSLESIQRRHEEDTATVREQLSEAQSGREHAEGRYQKLLGQVNTIKQQLGERLKSDAEELSAARTQIETLEQENATAKASNVTLESQITELNSTRDQQEEEIKSLRGRTNLSQQNWAKERDELAQREASLREEYEDAKQAMQDWEVLAMEERSQKETLSDRVAELEEQLSTQRDAYERAAADRDSQSVTVDGLQRALQDIQDARKRELREVVENSQTQIEELKEQLKVAEEASATAQASLETTRQELERAAPFEKEVKEKNLLIGKLRHEGVILNDHLTKALRFLKKGKPEDTVDRRLITNHLLHFLALDRTDPKKFQVLQLISALLGWTDEQKESAGLARPGTSSSYNGNASSTSASGSSLRLPLSPFRRASSNTSLSTSFNNQADSTSSEPRSGLTSPGTPTGRNETLAELWSEFLEREAAEGGADGHGKKKSRGPMSPRTGSRRQSSFSSSLAEEIASPTDSGTPTASQS